MKRAARPSAGLAAFLREARGWADAALARHLPPADAAPRELHEAVHYAVFGGGKRLRPALVRLVCGALGGDEAAAAAPAAAVELVHTYSLVHDDLPCMDDDELRRGRPTVHVRFGEALAVLVGDALLTAAFGALAAAGDEGAPLSAERAVACARVLAEGAGTAGMVGGQALDLARSAEAADHAAVRDIHRKKTAALIGAAAEMGAVAAGAGGDARRAAHRYGVALGRLFQAVDDLLDVTGDARALGKTPGKDAAQGKATLVAALGLGEARREAERLADEARGACRELGCREGALPLALVDHFLRRNA